MQNNYYIIVANIVGCTSLKALIECSFVVPYYAIQRNFSLFAPVRKNFRGKSLSKKGRKGSLSKSFQPRVFTEEYELAIFNLSVLADYGTLFFSLLMALNRLAVVAFSEYNFGRCIFFLRKYL